MVDEWGDTEVEMTDGQEAASKAASSVGDSVACSEPPRVDGAAGMKVVEMDVTRDSELVESRDSPVVEMWA